MNYRIIIYQVIFFAILVSCKPTFKMQVYSVDRQIHFCDSCDNRKLSAKLPKKSIVLISDSTLNFTTIYGGLGNSTKIKYRLSNDSLILKTEDIYGRKLENVFEDFSAFYKYSADSLISLQNDEKYYSDSYINSKTKKGFEPFFIIIDNKKHKITGKKRARRILKKVNPEDNFAELDKDIAKSKYGIEKRFKTFKVAE
jgi:hypothetical protein